MPTVRLGRAVCGVYARCGRWGPPVTRPRTQRPHAGAGFRHETAVRVFRSVSPARQPGRAGRARGLPVATARKWSSSVRRGLAPNPNACCVREQECVKLPLRRPLLAHSARQMLDLRDARKPAEAGVSRRLIWGLAARPRRASQGCVRPHPLRKGTDDGIDPDSNRRPPGCDRRARQWLSLPRYWALPRSLLHAVARLLRRFATVCPGSGRRKPS